MAKCDTRISMMPNTMLIQILNNLVDLKEKRSRGLTSEVGFNYSCLSEAVHEYYRVYSHPDFVSVGLMSSVFHP